MSRNSQAARKRRGLSDSQRFQIVELATPIATFRRWHECCEELLTVFPFLSEDVRLDVRTTAVRIVQLDDAEATNGDR
jgi:hypothetical protein